MRVRLERLESKQDITEINRIQKLAFQESLDKYKFCPAFEATDEDIEVYLAHSDGYKILLDDFIIGSIFIYKIKDYEYELNTISILPEFQDKGIGNQVISLVEALYPDALVWTLQTPELDDRNRYLYEKHGYIKEGTAKISEQLTLIQYKKPCRENI